MLYGVGGGAPRAVSGGSLNRRRISTNSAILKSLSKVPSEESLLQVPTETSHIRTRRRAVTTSDHKTCALVQTRYKLGDIM